MDIYNFVCLYPCVFFLEIGTREWRIVQRLQLHIWAAAGHELSAVGTHAQSLISD